MASTLYLKGQEVAQKALLNIASAPSGTVKLAFMATSYTPNAGTDQYWSDISASLASGTSLVTLSSVAVNTDTGNARIEIDAADVSESTITATTDKFVILVDTGTPSTSPLVCCVDIVEGTLAPVAGTLGITFNAEGIFAIGAT